MTLRLALLGAAALAVGAVAAERPLAIDPDYSVVEVEVHALMRDFHARLARFQAYIALDSVDGTVSAATFDFDWADLLTGNPARDRELLRWVDHARFPAGRFHLHGIERAADGTVRAHGELMLHGVTHEISFPVTILADHDLISLDGAAELDFRDYGLPPVRRFHIRLVKPSLLVRFHLQGRVDPMRARN